MKRLLFVFLLALPVLAQAQKKESSPEIDSLIKELPKKLDLKSNTGLLLANIGFDYNKIGNYPKAIEYYNKAIKILSRLDDENALARTIGNMGSSYLAMGVDTTSTEKQTAGQRNANIYKAIEALKQSIAISKRNGLTEVLNIFYKDLAEAERVLDYNVAKANAKANHDDTKEPSIEDESVSISNLESRRNQELQEKQNEINRIKAANEQKEKYYYIAGALILIIATVVMYRNYTKQKANTLLISEEKKKSEDLLLNILPAQVADELKEKGMVHAQHFDDVTVLITDFAGFTNVAERFSPKQLVGELHACFKAFDGMLDKFHIEKIKTVGDAYLVASGLPSANPNHATDMVAVAIAMRDFMLYRKTQLGDATFDMRIGVHSGSVVAGIVGVKKFAYDIWGDTVNLAARMEQNCEPGKINISESTYKLVKDKFECEYRGEIQAKNKGKLKMYFLNKAV